MSGAHGILKRLHTRVAGYDYTDPGASGTIAPDRQFAICELVTAAAEARTLSDPLYPGQVLGLVLKTDGGDCTITADTAVDQSGTTSLVLDDAGDGYLLYGIEDGSSLEWRIIKSFGATGEVFDEGLSTDTISEATSGSGVTADGVLLKDGAVTTGTVTEATSASGVKIDSGVVRDGQFHGLQPTPTAETGAATITIADILSGIVTLTHAVGATVALTLDTGTAMDTGMPASFGTNQYIDWSLINLSAAAADTGTVTAAATHTVVGVMIVQSAHASTGELYGNAGHFRSRRTAANTWVTYRIG